MIKLNESLLERGKNILLALACIFILNTFAIVFLGYILDQPWHLIDSQYSTWQYIIYACIVAPPVEELIFRWAPNRLLIHSPYYDDFKWPLAVITSVVFGWTHGNYFNVWVQGTGGFMLSWVYIRNRQSYISSTITHSIWNFTLCIIYPALMNTPTPNPFGYFLIK